MNSYSIWQGYMQSYDFLTKVDGYAQNMNDIATTANPFPGASILDAGSGTGNLSLLLKSKGAKVLSCDYSSVALARHKDKDPDATLMQASLEKPLSLPGQSFDTVCCASVLFALSQSGCDLALSEFHRVLRPEGRLVLTVPAQEAKLGKLVQMHLRTIAKAHGKVRGLPKFLADLPALTNVLYYNAKLKALPDWQGFHAFKEDELAGLVAKAGFERIERRRTYGGVFLMVSAVRAAQTFLDQVQTPKSAA